MKSADFITENRSRLNVKTTTSGPRTFFEGYLNPEANPTPTWLRILSKTPLAVESTAEITQGDMCYIGHIQAHQNGQGYASELVKYIIDYYKKQSIYKFYAYINHANVNSQNLFRKAGFVEAIKKREGSYWELNTSVSELNWMSESLSHLSVDDRITFFEELLTKKYANRFKSD